MSEQAWIHVVVEESGVFTIEQLQETIDWLGSRMDLTLPLDYRETVKRDDPVERWKNYEWKIGILHQEIKVRLGAEPRQLGPWLKRVNFPEWDGNLLDGYWQACRRCTDYHIAARQPDIPLRCLRCGEVYPILETQHSNNRNGASGAWISYAPTCNCGFSDSKSFLFRNFFRSQKCANCDASREDTSRFDRELWGDRDDYGSHHVLVPDSMRTLCGGHIRERAAGWRISGVRWREWRCQYCLHILKKREAQNAPT